MAGWAILLDYLIVMAIGAVVISDYLAVFWSELDEGVLPSRDRGAPRSCSWRCRTSAACRANRLGTVLRLSLVSIVVLVGVSVIGVRPVLGPGRDHRRRSTSAWPRAGTT